MPLNFDKCAPKYPPVKEPAINNSNISRSESVLSISSTNTHNSINDYEEYSEYSVYDLCNDVDVHR